MKLRVGVSFLYSFAKFSLQLCQIQVNNSFLNPVLLNLLFEIPMNVAKPLDFICTSYLVFFVVLGVVICSRR